jgi:hypothetical protein
MENKLELEYKVKLEKITNYIKQQDKFYVNLNPSIKLELKNIINDLYSFVDSVENHPEYFTLIHKSE